MHCEGKCCLRKKLERDGKQQAPSPIRQKLQQIQVYNLFMPGTAFSIKSATRLELKQKFFLRDETFTADFPRAVFHPPAA